MSSTSTGLPSENLASLSTIVSVSSFWSSDISKEHSPSVGFVRSPSSKVNVVW